MRSGKRSRYCFGSSINRVIFEGLDPYPLFSPSSSPFFSFLFSPLLSSQIPPSSSVSASSFPYTAGWFIFDVQPLSYKALKTLVFLREMKMRSKTHRLSELSSVYLSCRCKGKTSQTNVIMCVGFLRGTVTCSSPCYFTAQKLETKLECCPI